MQLLATSKIHPTFHVSLLKRHHGPIPVTLDASLPEKYDTNSQALPKVPVAVQEIRTVKQKNAAQVQCLIRWSHRNQEEAT